MLICATILLADIHKLDEVSRYPALRFEKKIDEVSATQLHFHLVGHVSAFLIQKCFTSGYDRGSGVALEFSVHRKKMGIL